MSPAKGSLPQHGVCWTEGCTAAVVDYGGCIYCHAREALRDALKSVRARLRLGRQYDLYSSHEINILVNAADKEMGRQKKAFKKREKTQ